ncbi:thioredoxin M2, chloroplastic-like [Hordeum vulgare subsp. vulgare]|uniref:Thioredoxin domain-containing protein n=1 Tax=Hordeum vulgare subsp. vulgare TaxID=112509 RepID=A0A8I6XN47_HORVV|nr:thioredoxin M2, chloroplastic-like [Hordeum vulgare subsp. vulgare]
MTPPTHASSKQEEPASHPRLPFHPSSPTAPLPPASQQTRSSPCFRNSPPVPIPTSTSTATAMASVAASSSPLAAASLAVSRRPHHALPPARGPRPQAQAQALRAVSGPAGSRRWGVRRGASVVRAVQGQDTTIQVPDVTKATWQSLVIESEIPVLVEFWASWCGPCKMIDPVIGKLSKEYEGKLKCYKLNTDENPDIASQYGVRSIPTMMIFKNGEKKDAVIGAVPESTLITCIEKFTER